MLMFSTDLLYANSYQEYLLDFINNQIVSKDFDYSLFRPLLLNDKNELDNIKIDLNNLNNKLENGYYKIYSNREVYDINERLNNNIYCYINNGKIMKVFLDEEQMNLRKELLDYENDKLSKVYSMTIDKIVEVVKDNKDLMFSIELNDIASIKGYNEGKLYHILKDARLEAIRTLNESNELSLNNYIEEIEEEEDLEIE